MTHEDIVCLSLAIMQEGDGWGVDHANKEKAWGIIDRLHVQAFGKPFWIGVWHESVALGEVCIECRQLLDERAVDEDD